MTALVSAIVGALLLAVLIPDLEDPSSTGWLSPEVRFAGFFVGCIAISVALIAVYMARPRTAW